MLALQLRREAQYGIERRHSINNWRLSENKITNWREKCLCECHYSKVYIYFIETNWVTNVVSIPFWFLVLWGRGGCLFLFLPGQHPTSLRVAAAAAKSLQSCPTLCDPTDGSPLGYPVPGILQARTLEWVAISFSSAWKGKVKVKSLQSCLTLWASVGCGPPGSSIHGISQARILEWVAISFSWGSFRPRNWTQVSHTAGTRFTFWATREAGTM